MEPCPSCKRVDNVQKVSAIVSAGQSYGSAAGGPTIHTSSDLAGYLSMPSKPIVAPPGGCSMIMLILSAAGVAILLLRWLVAIAADSGDDFGFLTTIFLCPATLLLIVAVSAYVYRRRGTASAQEDEQELVAWNYMRPRWDRAYYCSRCDAVYVEGEPGWTPRSNMWSFLARRG
jgi:hypothetical protein